MDNNDLGYVIWTPPAMPVPQLIEMVWAFIKQDEKRRFSIHRDAPVLLRHIRVAFYGKSSIDSFPHHDGITPSLRLRLVTHIEAECNKYIENDPEAFSGSIDNLTFLLPSLKQLDAETLDKDAQLHANAFIDDIDGPDDVESDGIDASDE